MPAAAAMRRGREAARKIAWVMFSLLAAGSILAPAGPFPQPASQILVIGSSTAFRRHPGDDLVRIRDIARLAVHTVRGVDLQPERSGLGFVRDHLVNVGGAEV